MWKSVRLFVVCAAILVASFTARKASAVEYHYCYANGGFISVGDNAVFVCPMGGAYQACAYPCAP